MEFKKFLSVLAFLLVTNAWAVPQYVYVYNWPYIQLIQIVPDSGANPSNTPTLSPTETYTPTPTFTPTNTLTFTRTPTPTFTIPAGTNTWTPVNTATFTFTPTRTFTYTPTITPTPTETYTTTNTPILTKTPYVIAIPPGTQTPTVTANPTQVPKVLNDQLNSVNSYLSTIDQDIIGITSPNEFKAWACPSGAATQSFSLNGFVPRFVTCQGSTSLSTATGQLFGWDSINTNKVAIGGTFDLTSGAYMFFNFSQAITMCPMANYEIRVVCTVTGTPTIDINANFRK